MDQLTPELVGAIGGAILSGLFAVLPVLKTKFDAIPPEWKPIANVLVLLTAALGWLLVSCRLDWACIKVNAGAAGMAFFYAVVSNQVTFLTAIKQVKKASARKAELKAMWLTDAELKARMNEVGE